MGKSKSEVPYRLFPIATALTLAVTMLSCGHISLDTSIPDTLPNLPVAYTIDLMSAEGRSIASPQTAILILTPRQQSDLLGVGGLIVCYGLPGEVEGGGYAAYDAQCPLCYPTRGIVMPDHTPAEETLMSATCSHCLAVYDLSLGVGQQTRRDLPPAVLKHYPTILRGRDLVIGN